MKLAEALLERKTLALKVQELTNRATQNALVQEGDSPAEAPLELLRELRETAGALGDLIRKINATNNAATLENGETISAAIVRRDVLDMEIRAMQGVLGAANVQNTRFSRNEIKFVAVVDAAQLRRELDEIAKTRRELDAAIQALNWTTELLE